MLFMWCLLIKLSILISSFYFEAILMNRDKLEKALVQLMQVCNQEGVAISGALDFNGEMLSYCNTLSGHSMQYTHIKMMVEKEGEIDQFLIGVSRLRYDDAANNILASANRDEEPMEMDASMERLAVVH